ncbi:Piwi-like protein 1 [Orchesella cincta]|uniref:Piwi-like protein 1 n=1 Tax=Orchesella cincta TaxID=48709 RepID=A0A1D2N509_ORCCI|nr:Piwi-like protein 1 [Orchesella cincta]
MWREGDGWSWLSFGDRVNLPKAGPDFSREAGLSVYDPIEVKRYAVISTQRDSDKAKRFIEMYQQVSKPLGIKMMQLGTLVTLRGFMPHDFNNALRGLDPNTTQFVVIIMPMQRDDVYAAIKKFCVADCPIPSQCILSKTLGNEKRLRSIVLKIALQINCKLGGSLWALQMPLKEQVMFVGIDAAHDPLKKDPSTVCLVASLNNECTKYYSKAASGRVHQEMAESLRGMLEDAINYFQSVRHRVPDRIIVFRDGGSVGAMEHIEKTEMEQLMQAQQKLAPDASFTFAVVAKRIPQRFFLDQGRKGFDNLQPGSVVDNTVTRRHYFDFYMVSQQVRQVSST